MATQSEIKQLKNLKKSYKSQLTKFQTYLTKEFDKEIPEFSQIQLRLSKIEPLLDFFYEAFHKAQNLSEDDTENPQDIKELDDFEENYFNIVSAATKILEMKTANPPDQNIDNQSASSGTSAQHNEQKIVLPPITLPNFDGKYEQWLFFRDTFVSLVHNNNIMPDINKFHHLRSSLRGQASELLSSLEITASNYQVAWEILVKRYENKKILIKNHIKAIFDCQQATKDTAAELRMISDHISKHLRALEVLGEPIDKWDSLLIHICASKLDPQTRREWEIRHAKEVDVNYTTFNDFLDEKCKVMEILENSQTNKNKSKSVMQPVKGFQVSTKLTCVFCSQEHYILNCKKFIDLSPQNKLIQVKKLKLCINCLRLYHFSKDCRSTNCKKCNLRHNTILHDAFSHNQSSDSDTKPENSTKEPNYANNHAPPLQQPVHSNSAFFAEQNENKVLLSTAIVTVRNADGHQINCRVLLDSGSESSFISEEFSNKLGLKTSSINCSITGINQKTSKILNKTSINLESRQGSYKLRINCLVLKTIANKIPNKFININHLEIPVNIVLADPSFNNPGPIDILIGADHFYELLMIGQVSLGKNAPTLQKTHLGWIISGIVTPSNYISEANSITCNFSSITEDSINESLNKFWNIENIHSTSSYKEKQPVDSCEELFINTTIRDNDGRFIVKLPLKQDPIVLGNSYQLAVKQFKNMEKRLNSNNSLKTHYGQFLQEYEDLKHMEKIDDNIIKNIPHYYMPHHAVFKESSSTTKLRVVFNASAATSNGISLNEIMKVGPTIQDDLFSILLRVRKHNIMLTADITKMYRQVLIDKTQRSLQLILWRSNITEPISTYQLNTITYGTAPAAFLSTRCLIELSNQCETTLPQISSIIAQDFYVDDLCTGGSTIQEVIFIKKNVTSILKSGGFPLTKFMSNNKEVLTNESKSENTIIHFGEPTEIKTLGLLWDSQSDKLKYSVILHKYSVLTKRILLSTISKIFDPLGLIQPVIIIAKVMVQQLWKLQLSWDESLPINIHTKWLNFENQLQQLNNLEIPRHALPNNITSIQLHGFSDASEMAYGACLYLRAVDNFGMIHIHLLCSKTRVCPLKTVTIPKLELCAALLLSELYDKAKIALKININETYLWSDSQIVLHWLKKQPEQWKIFVSNRVAQIQSLSNANDWNYVPTHQNPADILSRGLSPEKLICCSLWWEGPEFLKKPNKDWPLVQQEIIDGDNVPEKRKEKMMALFGSTDDPFELINRYSSFTKLNRITALCFRFQHNCKSSPSKRKTGSLSIEELSDALHKIIKYIQRIEFTKDYEFLSKNKSSVHPKSKLLRLNPFMDNNGLIRVGGRLKRSTFNFNKKHPIILPNKSYFTRLVIEYEHIRNLHPGPQLLLSIVREKFWPIYGRVLARKIVHNCIKCFKCNPRPETYLMGELPKVRVTPARPFLNVGIDFCGPFDLKDRSTRKYQILKCYVCLFVCLSTKAIHLELVSGLSTILFMSALKRFFARRGLSSNIYSDNGTNFIGTKNEIEQFLLKFNNTIQDQLSTIQVQWHLIPPRAPHFGGIWEAGVKSVKYHLKRVLNETPLLYEEFLTILNQVEACLNSRPISFLSDNPEDPAPLTPGHFLIGESLVALPEPDYLDVPELFSCNFFLK